MQSVFSSYKDQPVTREDMQQVTQLLGRPARGLVAIAVRGRTGAPVVIQVASLVDNKPFPTLFWLVDKTLNYKIDRLEASGFITHCQRLVDASPELQALLAAEHQAYIALRRRLMTRDHAETLTALGYMQILEKRGIGGIENFTRIRCLHTYYAAHLVSPNQVGLLVAEVLAGE